MTDILIVGGGPAGIAAAIYARRAGRTVKIIERLAPGGQISSTPKIENYPAIKQIEGFQLAMDMESHARGMGAEFVYKNVTAIDTKERAVMCGDERIEARALILAMGVGRRKIGCPGEEVFSGRGVSYCATCDGAFFKGKAVAVVGGGSAAMEDALYLGGLGCAVTIIHKHDKLTGREPLKQSVLANPKITLRLEQTVEEIKGTDKVGSITIKHNNTGELRELEVAGVFAAVGVMPDTKLVEGQVKLTASGHIDCGEDCRTECEGVFAAGDLRKKTLYQIVTACADGAVAATAASQYISAM